MQYSVTFRHMEPSDPLKEYSQEKLARLEKYLDAVIDAEVVMTVEKFRHRAEVIINSDGLKIKAEEETEDMYSAIDMVVDKLEKQIKRHREKLKDHKSAAAKRQLKEAEADFSPEAPQPERNDPGPAHPAVARVVNHRPESLSIEAAVEKLSASAENWLLFLNRDDEHLSILRRLKDGQLELVRINH